MMYKHLCDTLTPFPSVGKWGDRVMARMARLLHEQWFWEHSGGPFPTTLSASPCHCCLVERANHMEKHILLVSPSHCLFSQESLLSRPHATLLIWLSMVALTVSCDRHLRGPKARSLPSSPENIYDSCSSLNLDSCVSQMFYVLCYASITVGWRKKRVLETTPRRY